MFEAASVPAHRHHNSIEDRESQMTGAGASGPVAVMLVIQARRHEWSRMPPTARDQLSPAKASLATSSIAIDPVCSAPKRNYRVLSGIPGRGRAVGNLVNAVGRLHLAVDLTSSANVAAASGSATNKPGDRANAAFSEP